MKKRIIKSIVESTRPKLCMNSYGWCTNPAIELEYNDGFRVKTTTNFCSTRCLLMYKGEIKPPILERPDEYRNEESQLIHDIYTGKLKPTKVTIRTLPRKEWISTLKHKSIKGINLNQTFMYDPWDKKFYQYKLGIGLVDDLDKVIVLENSEYFHTLRDVCNDPEMEIPKRPIKHKIPKTKQRLPNTRILSQSELNSLPKDWTQCQTCGQPVRIHSDKGRKDLTNMVPCPNCGWNIHRWNPDNPERITIEEWQEKKRNGIPMINVNKINVKKLRNRRNRI